MIRISHAEFDTAQRDFLNWWRAKQAPAPGGRSFGYAQAVKLAIYRFHKGQGDSAAALSHFDQLSAGRFKDARRVAKARFDLETYIDWYVRSGVIVADYRVRLDLRLGDGVTFGGEVSRIDIEGQTYRATLVSQRVSKGWERERRMPLIQLAVAQKYDRDPEDVNIAVQLIDGSGLSEMTFDAPKRQEALADANRVADRIRRAMRRKP